MIPLHRNRSISFGVLCVLAAVPAQAEHIQPQISGFRSNERITHLAPGGANAAREIEVTVALFDSEGRPLALQGTPILVEGLDGARASGATRVGQVTAMTDNLGQAQVRLPLDTCKGSGVIGPVRVHRVSNRPEYWDVTYIPAYIRAKVADAYATASFIHISREIYRGTRP